MPRRAVLLALRGALLDPTAEDAAADHVVSDLTSAYDTLEALVGGASV